MKLKYFVPAIFGSLLACSAAFAVPVLPPAHIIGQGAETPLIQARTYYYVVKGKHYTYVPGHVYRTAPHGWHRYNERPRDWRIRNCILVGPIWFCP